MKSPMSILLVSLALMIPLRPALAFADDDDQVTRFVFDDHLVPGDLVRSDGEIFQVRRRSSRDTLIRAREGFVAELYKSVANL